MKFLLRGLLQLKMKLCKLIALILNRTVPEYKLTDQSTSFEIGLKSTVVIKKRHLTPKTMKNNKKPSQIWVRSAH